MTSLPSGGRIRNNMESEGTLNVTTPKEFEMPGMPDQLAEPATQDQSQADLKIAALGFKRECVPAGLNGSTMGRVSQNILLHSVLMAKPSTMIS